ncbi:MAG: serine/threonine-protein kinase [Nannocystaceae bacterium]|nr:serine/threonine-protein kinase [Nannocystaceae bacterium]
MSSNDLTATGPLDGATGPAPNSSASSAGALIGRYVTLGTLGRGGGGEVFSAFDAVLDRKVAIKLLHGSEETKPALIREGRMLAKVSHPGVLEVYEVGFHEGQAYMAMELVGGGDLEAFARHQRQAGDVAGIVAALIQVCGGIIAAHEADIVHGDIKPANVLRTESGVFKVSDFGIAQLRSAAAHQGTGNPVGTLAFMAPEQHAGKNADERTDQYSFCVTAWLALTGSLPFHRDGVTPSTQASSLGATGPLEDIETLKQNGPPAWPAVHAVPRAVADALRRGLAPDPSARWPSMAALVEELKPNLGQARFRRMVVVLGAGALVAGAAFGFAAYQERATVARCEAAGHELDGMWNEDVAADVRTALESGGSPYGVATADRVLPRLDDWKNHWAEVRMQTCTAHAVEGAWDDNLAARARWCLEEGQLGFDAAVQRLQAPESAALDGAVAMAASLPSVDVCGDAYNLGRRRAPPAQSQRDNHRAVLIALAKAGALDNTGSYAEGLEAVEDSKRLLDTEPSSPLHATILVTQGRLHSHAGAYAQSEAALSRAYTLAASGEDWTTAALAAESLTFVLGAKQDRPAEGAAWAGHAEIASTLGGDPLRLHETARSANLAVVQRALGNYDEAIALHEHALQAGAQAFGLDHPERASTMGNLGAVYMEKGDATKALALFEQASQLRERALGALHPMTVSSLGNLAAGLAKSGQLRRAKEILETVLERREKALGPDHPDVGQALDNAAAVSNMLGDSKTAEALLERSLKIKRRAVPGTTAEAETLSHLATAKSANGDSRAAVQLLERCLQIRETVRGLEHASVGEALVNLGTEHFILGDLPKAEAMYLRAKTIYAATLGESHPGYGAALNNLGDVALESGRYANAVELYAQAHEIWKTSLGPDHPHTATALAHAGDAWLRDGNPAKARPLLEQAITAFKAGEGTQEQEAQAHFGLAKVLDEAREHEAATASAAAARAVLVALGGGQMLHPADIDAWLAAR